MDCIIWVKNKQMLSKEEQNKVSKQNDQYARLSMGGWAIYFRLREVDAVPVHRL